MNANQPHLLLKHYLKKLKLPTMLRDYEAVAAPCARDNCDYVCFLLSLVERETLDRDKRAAERRVKNVRFPVIKTLDTFDFRAPNRMTRQTWNHPALMMNRRTE